MKKVLLFIISLSIFLLLPHAVYAQEVSLGVFPPLLEINATPPTAIRQNVTLSNQSDSPITVAVSFRPFTQSPENNGQVTFLPKDQVFGADPHIFDKIQLLDDNQPVSTLTLDPRQNKTLTLHIGLPKDEPGGDYYFSIVFTTLNPSSPATDGSSVSGGIASNVLLSVGPTGPTTGTLAQFSAPWFLTTGPVPFNVLLDNLSSHFIAPTGEILIKNMYGQLVGQVNLLPVNVLASSSRYIPGTTDHNLTTATWNEKVLLGPYKATLIISLSPQGPLFRQTIYFVAIPWQYLLGFAISIFLISIIVFKVRNRIHSTN